MNSMELISNVRSWLGVPFTHQGRSRFGVDCIGLPIVVLRENCLMPRDFYDYTSYGRSPDGQMEPIVARYCTRINTPVAGALMLIKWPSMKQASHAAFFTEKSTMIHSYQRAGKVVENGFRGTWVKYLHSVWKLPGIDYV